MSVRPTLPRPDAFGIEVLFSLADPEPGHRYRISVSKSSGPGIVTEVYLPDDSAARAYGAALANDPMARVQIQEIAS